MRNQSVALLLAALTILFLSFFFLFPFVIIGAGERGIVLTFGAFGGEILQPGLHLRMPIAQKIIQVDVQTQKGEVEVSAASKDLQSVTATVAVNFYPSPERVGDLYTKVGLRYESRIIAPAIQEAVKATTARFTAEELITQRQEVKEQTKLILAERLLRENLIVEELAIVDFSFADSFDAAIEAKVTAEQDALAAKNKLEQVKFEAQQAIERAKAEAESIRIQASAINAQGGADYVQLQAIGKWNGVLPAQMIPGSTVPFINLR